VEIGKPLVEHGFLRKLSFSHCQPDSVRNFSDRIHGLEIYDHDGQHFNGREAVR
jgi:hypothetical protein